MKKLLSAGLAATLLGGSLALVATGTGAVAAVEGQARDAARAAARAEKALAKDRHDLAVRHAEQAVALMPGEAGYRALLGRAYLDAGRFRSAAQAFGDTLSIDPADGRSALNLALAQTALGDWVAARTTLATHRDTIGVADRGLALALAGDPAGGVTLLAEAARDPAATSTVRQNLALALALSGRWMEAKAVAAIDVAPAEVDARLAQWATFARPAEASTQVASLLGVTAVADGGLPERLALVRAPVAVALATAPQQDVVAAVAVEGVVADEATVPTARPATATLLAAAAMQAPTVTFAPRREIVQAIPFRAVSGNAPVRSAAAAAPVRPATARPATGSWFVQLGAYDNEGVARDAWRRASRGMPQLAAMSPSGMHARVGGATYYRLSVGGFARPDAAALCRQVRAGGNPCFVRGHAGEQLAGWAARGTQVAAN